MYDLDKNFNSSKTAPTHQDAAFVVYTQTNETVSSAVRDLETKQNF